MLFKPHHLFYFKKWAHLFENAPAPLLHPGFFLFEVPSDHLQHHSLLMYTPAVTMIDWRADMHLFRCVRECCRARSKCDTSSVPLGTTVV